MRWMPPKQNAAARPAETDVTVSGEAAMAEAANGKGASTLRSVFSNWAGLVINGVVSLVLTPILVHGLGDLYFGMFTLVASLLDSYWLLDFGMRTTIFRFVARYQGGGRRRELNETFASGLAIALLSASAILLLTMGAFAVLPRFFAVAGGDRMIFRWLLALSGAALAAAFTAQFLGTYLCAFRRFDLYNLLSVMTGLVRAGLIVLAFRLHMGIRAVALATLVASASGLLASVRAVWIADPALAVSMKNVYRERIRELLSFSSHAFLGTLGDQLRFFVDSVVIGRVLSIALITPFAIPLRLMTLFRQLGVALASPMAGVMSEMEGRKVPEESREYFLFATRMCALLSLFIGLLLLVNGQAIIRVWVGPAYLGSYRLLVILLAGQCLMLAQQPSVDLLIAKGKHRFRGWWTLAEGLANLFLSIYWARKYGLVGIAWGTTVPMLVVQLLVQPWYTLHTAALNVMRYLRHALARPVLISVLYLGVCWLAKPWLHTANVWQLLLTVGWQSLLFGALTWVLGLTAYERRRLIEKARGLANPNEDC